MLLNLAISTDWILNPHVKVSVVVKSYYLIYYVILQSPVKCLSGLPHKSQQTSLSSMNVPNHSNCFSRK